MTGAALRPALTMSDIYGPGHLSFPRAHDAASDWLPNGPHKLDSLTGGQLVIAGDMPVVCSEGFNSGAGLELMEMAGLEPVGHRIHYRAGRELSVLSNTLAETDATLVVQHAFPDGVLPADRFWIEPALLRQLNNKALLTDLVRPENAARRKTVDRADYFAAIEPTLPVVIKVVSNQSNGGGSGVAVCRTPAEWRRAAGDFVSCDTVVVETFLEIVRNPCLNFAVMRNGEVRYLGFADQDVSSGGKHRGNWLDLADSLPRDAIDVATEPIRRAAGLGYRGIAGIDLAFTRDGEIYVLDLNFRVNASTPAVLLAAPLAERRGGGIMHFRRVSAACPETDLAKALTPYVQGGRIVPLNLFDARLAGYPEIGANAQVLIIGQSRDEVMAIETELAVAGID